MSARTWHVLWIAGLVVIGVIWAQSSRASLGADGPADIPDPTSGLAIEPIDRVTVSSPGPRSDADAGIVVHVSGAILRPGLIRLAATSRVADAVRAGGGLLPTADIVAINLAAPVADGEHVHIPAIGETTPAVTGPAAAGTESTTVRLNQATVDDLVALPGVGPVLAQRIVDYRDANGPFAVVEDLLDVPGIGEGRLAELRTLISVP